MKCKHIQGLSIFLFLSPWLSISIFLCCCSCFCIKLFYVMQSLSLFCKVPHLPFHHVSIHVFTSVILSLFTPPSRYPIHPISTSHPWIHPPIQPTFPFPCGTKLIEDDWFFPGCSDSALETRQEELEEELAQARGLGQHRPKKLAAPSQRSLQVGGQAGTSPHVG